jgi:threonine synthase
MNSPRLSPYLSGVRCFDCETPHDPRQLLTVCTKCGLPLLVGYDLSRAASAVDLLGNPPSWRYRELLPLHGGDEDLIDRFYAAAARRAQRLGEGRSA